MYVGPWLPEPLVGDAEPPADAATELASDLSVAFLAVLERLAPEERAAFLLHDVFDAEYADVAAVLRKSEVACRQIVSRARTRVRHSTPPARARADRRLSGPGGGRALFERSQTLPSVPGRRPANFGVRGAIRAWLHPEGHVEPVPPVDGHHGQRELHELRLGEVLAYRRVDVVGHVRVPNEREALGPFERRALAVGIERRLAPRVEQVETLLGLTGRARGETR